MRFHRLCVVVLALSGSAGQATAEVIDYDTTIDYTIEEEIGVFEGANPNPPTIVNVVEPATIGGIAAADSSVVNVYGGRIVSTGDDADEAVIATDTGVVNFFGGEVISNFEALATFGHGTINVYDGLFRSWVDAEEYGTINIFGGSFEGPIIAGDTEAQIHIHGGNIPRLEVGEWCQMTVYGTGFNYPYGPIPDDAGVLTGVLSNGQAINAEFNIDKTYSENVSIVLAMPEPSTFAMLATSAVGLFFMVRRHHRRPGHSRKTLHAIPKKVAT